MSNPYNLLISSHDLNQTSFHYLITFAFDYEGRAEIVTKI